MVSSNCLILSLYIVRAIRESLLVSSPGIAISGERNDNTNASTYDEQLQIALAMSEQEVMKRNREEKSENDELERILKLSLTEK